LTVIASPPVGIQPRGLIFEASDDETLPMAALKKTIAG